MIPTPSYDGRPSKRPPDFHRRYRGHQPNGGRYIDRADAAMDNDLAKRLFL